MRQNIQRLLWVDIAAKVFLGWRTKILRAADAFYAQRREGPYRFIQNRSRISVVALKSDAAAEKSKDQLSRDFLGCSIFDFCNNICQKRPCLMRCFRLLPVQMRSILASVTTVFHRLRSLDTNSLKSLGLPGAGSLPSARRR